MVERTPCYMDSANGFVVTEFAPGDSVPATNLPAGVTGVAGPQSSTTHGLARFVDDDGAEVESTGIAVDDNDAMTGVASINGRVPEGDGQALDDHLSAAAPHSGHATTGAVALAQSAADDAQDDIDAHAVATAPHSGHEVTSAKGQANGYASLGAGGRVPMAQLASGTPDGTKFLRDDGVLATPPGGGGTGNVTGSGTSIVGQIPALGDTTTTTLVPTPTTINPTTGSITLPTGATVDGVDVSTVPGLITAEATARASADTTLQTNITAEATARAAAVTAEASARATAVANEATTRAQEDLKEANNRAIADGALDTRLDAIESVDQPAIQEVLRQAGAHAAADALTGDSEHEILWQTSGRWMCGRSTAGFAQPFFYSESATGASFANGGTVELYVPIGAPNANSAPSGSNAAAASQYGSLLLSQHNDEGICIPPGRLIQGAKLDIWLPVYIKCTGTRTLYLVLDPDGDVRFKSAGFTTTVAANPWSEKPVMLGHEVGTVVAAEIPITDDGGDCLFTFTDHSLVDDQVIWCNDAHGFETDTYPDGVVPDMDALIGQGVYVVVIDDDTFKVSTTAGGGNIVAYNPTGTHSLDVVITKELAQGSHKRLPFAWTISTTSLDYLPYYVHVWCVADPNATNDEPEGAMWYADLVRAQNAEQVGDVVRIVPATEGTLTGFRTQRLNRTRPGTGVAATATDNSGCPLIQAKTSFGSVAVTNAKWNNTTKVLYSTAFKDVPVGSTIKITGGHAGTSGLTTGGAGYVVDAKSTVVDPGDGCHLAGSPGTGNDTTGVIWATSSNIHAYIPTWHDLSGTYSELLLDFVITPTGNMPMCSVKSDYSVATRTFLEVGGTPLGEVIEYYPERGVLRFRDLNDRTKIKAGDSVTLKLWRRPNTAYEAAAYYTTTFTAGLVRAGPHDVMLGLRAAMSGAQDGTCIADFRGGIAVLTGRRSN